MTSSDEALELLILRKLRSNAGRLRGALGNLRRESINALDELNAGERTTPLASTLADVAAAQAALNAVLELAASSGLHESEIENAQRVAER